MNENTKKSEISLLTEQIALLTQQINELNRHLSQHPVGKRIGMKKTRAVYHPIIDEFWKRFHQLDRGLPEHTVNHSDDGLTIAINLKHFNKVCKEVGIGPFDLYLLKKSLPASNNRLIEQNRVVWSRHLQKTLRCWIFEK